MTLVHYTAEVKSGLLLELPAEARALQLKPGDKVEVQLEAHKNPTPVSNQVKPVIDAENAAAIALLNSWLKEDVTDDPEEIRKSEEEYEELKRNLNVNRAATGERLVFPWLVIYCSILRL